MREKDAVREASFREYVREILQHAEYRPCEDSGCVIGVAGVLPGCMTQGETFEAARELLIDAIELWVLSSIKEGEELPVVNGSKLALYGRPEASLRELHACRGRPLALHSFAEPNSCAQK